MNLWTLLPGNGAKFETVPTLIFNILFNFFFFLLSSRKGKQGFCPEKYRLLTLSLPYLAQTSILCLASLAHKGWKEALQLPENTTQKKWLASYKNLRSVIYLRIQTNTTNTGSKGAHQLKYLLLRNSSSSTSHKIRLGYKDSTVPLGWIKDRFLKYIIHNKIPLNNSLQHSSWSPYIPFHLAKNYAIYSPHLWSHSQSQS